MGEKPREELIPGDEPLPEDIRKELEKMPDPSEEELKKYDYLKKPLLDAIKKAAEGKKKEKPRGKSEK